MQAAAPTNDTSGPIVISLYILIVVMFYRKISNVMIMISVGVGALIFAFELSMTIAVGAALITLGLLVYIHNREGFESSDATPIINQIRSIARSPRSIEGYEDVRKEKDETPAPADIKKKKNTLVSNEENKESDTLAKPFTLGEIPGQAKKGPHLDVSSTLMKAINNLNPEQIQAMSVDTKQLIETQKTLMGMLGTMKPMLNDGKELMSTFQDMFGKDT
jgi:hypothetical protein